MGIRSQLESSPETLLDLEDAAKDRYWDAQELRARGRGAAGVYLMGYVAEMLLKIACFRFDGAKQSDPVLARLAPARKFAAGVPHENYHNA